MQGFGSYTEPWERRINQMAGFKFLAVLLQPTSCASCFVNAFGHSSIVKMFLQAFTLLLLSLGALASPAVQPRHTSFPSLADLALQKILSDASPIFGYYTKNSTEYSTWMSKYPDSTQLVHMNIPGAHDPQTWNYSQATQDALTHVTDLDGNPPFPPEIYRCQEKSFMDMLSAGIRVFDIRYAFDVSLLLPCPALY